MELRQLQYFTAVFEERSVTRASQRLNVVQPALSQQISKLEKELGSLLFDRTSKGMVPTETGIEAYRLFSGVLRDLRAARQQLQESYGQVRGRISLGVVSSVANNALSEALLIFHKKYPDVHVSATGGYTDELLELLRLSRLDLIIVNVAPKARSSAFEDILTEELMLIGAADTPLPLPAPVEVTQLSNLKLVIPSQRHGLRGIMDRVALDLGQVLQPRLEFDDIAALENFVTRSDFFTILPPLAVHRGLRLGRLKAWPVTPVIPRRLVCMTTPDRPRSRVASLLIEELRERMLDFSTVVEKALHAGDDNQP